MYLFIFKNNYKKLIKIKLSQVESSNLTNVILNKFNIEKLS